MSRHSPTLYFVLLLLCVCCSVAHGQSLTTIDSAGIWPRRMYVVLENAPFSVHYVRAERTRKSSDPTTPVSVEIYNLLVPANIVYRMTAPSIHSKALLGSKDTLLLTLSVLPDEKSMINWVPIELDTIPTARILSFADVVQDGIRRIKAYREAGNPKDHLIPTRGNLLPIVRRQGRYWVPKSFVLAQYFLIRSRVTKFLTEADYVTINIKSPVIAPNAPWRYVRALLPAKGHYEYTTTMGIVPSSKQDGILEFWSRPQVTVSHPDIGYFGIGTFQYKPGIGVITGQYRSYLHYIPPYSSKIIYDHVIVDEKMTLR